MAISGQPLDASTVERIKELRAARWSKRRIAAELSLCKRTVDTYTRNVQVARSQVAHFVRRVGMNPLEAATMTHATIDVEPCALGCDDVARLAGVSAYTIRRWASDGQMPPPRRLARRTLRWPASVIRDWLQGESPEAPGLHPATGEPSHA